MLNHAKELDLAGRAVYVVAANQSHVRDIENHLGTNRGCIKVETPESLRNIDWQEMKLTGVFPNVALLVDHYVIESRFGAMLEMLHAYDPKTD